MNELNTTEIERRFLVDYNSFLGSLKSDEYLVVNTYNVTQGYVETKNGIVIRYRVRDIPWKKKCSEEGFHTVKGPKSNGEGKEYECLMDVDHVKDIIANYCDSKITKKRIVVKYDKQIWEVDHFEEIGLTIAEIELKNINQRITIPNWCKREITDEHEYSNYSLSKRNKDES